MGTDQKIHLLKIREQLQSAIDICVCALVGGGVEGVVLNDYNRVNSFFMGRR